MADVEGGESKIIESLDEVGGGGDDDLKTFVAGSRSTSGTVGVLRSPAAAAPGARPAPPSESSMLVMLTESVFIIEEVYTQVGIYAE